MTLRVSYVEARAAIASAVRHNRITSRGAQEAIGSLEIVWGAMWIIELTDPLVRRAAEFADAHALRGYDVTHCAAAELVHGRSVVAAAGDAALLESWCAVGFAVADTAP
ncbi:hypothetical protein BKA02_002489 [Microbacterium pseudoresistens]|uniref:PIN domain-containing protein n=1 Tax=Microbacterium pseudoresistens TaxID=640634 RepID=A0A7Y9JQ84_9MICO|nr:hypothetical protein [Microbacterium pseudoresistens]